MYIKANQMKPTFKVCINAIIILFLCSGKLFSQYVTNVPDRSSISLNGKWNYIIDPLDAGSESWIALYKDKKPTGKLDFYEYSFDQSPVMNVPGDFNSQLPELKYYEGAVWYKKVFRYTKKSSGQVFLNFDGVNYKCRVYLNGEKIGEHEGGFNPFQFDVTKLLKNGENSLLVYTNNARSKDGVPSVSYDWLNYGGITRDVSLIEMPQTYIADYFLQLKKGSKTTVGGWVKVAGKKLNQKIRVLIPEAKVNYTTSTNDSGFVALNFSSKLQLWKPGSPKLYQVQIFAETDTVQENIGFRSIEVKGLDILLNGEPIFLKGVNIHEEIPQRQARAYSESDARLLLGWAKELGCNFVRLAHYPHNENMVRVADELGLMVWSEIPVYQSMSFGNPQTEAKIITMVDEMIGRDKNRASIIIWSVANETSVSKDRNRVVMNAINECRKLDPARLVTIAMNNVKYDDASVTISDSISKSLDLISINEYLGWYNPWGTKAGRKNWISGFNKPIVISEFGAEALYGNHGPSDVASSWSEEYQEQVYKDQVSMFKTMPELRGTCAWLLADYRSPKRMHQAFQNGWNRKGLLSDQGFRKKAWYVLANYYKLK
jgi:beta-glucuronidase